MTTDLQRIRERLKVSQTAMADHLGMTLRAYQDIEAGKSKGRRAYIHSAEILAMVLAVERGDPSLISPQIHNMICQASDLIRNGPRPSSVLGEAGGFQTRVNRELPRPGGR